MWDFLSFNTFISNDILVILYYVLASSLALFLWTTKSYIQKKFENSKYITKKNVIMVLLFIFIVSELFLRVLFEFSIAYFDMHDYLQVLQAHSTAL